ncbi:hypothetical protein ACQP25_44605 (plasmid) [Microtetraspora malaysiensis]|uniref:hypothetical protein n=1 Tax=Microtetraspora malaysiensis TaxID=161358 RepID=UPI003D93711B
MTSIATAARAAAHTIVVATRAAARAVAVAAGRAVILTAVAAADILSHVAVRAESGAERIRDLAAKGRPCKQCGVGRFAECDPYMPCAYSL